jgi:heat shock protein HtpX
MAVTKTQFGRDPGLQARMLLTMFLLGALYVVFVGVLFAAGVNAGLIVIIAVGLSAAQLFTSDKLALHAMGAIAVAQTSMPNAFAIGRSQKSATVCATTGIMNLLSPAELEGVMAHELTHVKNRDVMIMTIASFFASVASMILQFGFFFGGGGQSDDDDGPGFLAVILVSLVVYAVSFFLMMALSRYREFAADRGAALITGRPSALASALQKIASGMQRLPQQDLRVAQELQAFFIFPAGAKNSLMGLFATHPPMEKRIAALARLEAELQRGTLAAA